MEDNTLEEAGLEKPTVGKFVNKDVQILNFSAYGEYVCLNFGKTLKVYTVDDSVLFKRFKFDESVLATAFYRNKLYILTLNCTLYVLEYLSPQNKIVANDLLSSIYYRQLVPVPTRIQSFTRAVQSKHTVECSLMKASPETGYVCGLLRLRHQQVFILINNGNVDTFDRFTESVSSFHFSSNSEYIFFCCDSGMVQLLHIKQMLLVSVVRPCRAEISSFSQEGPQLVIGYTNGKTFFYSIERRCLLENHYQQLENEAEIRCLHNAPRLQDSLSSSANMQMTGKVPDQKDNEPRFRCIVASQLIANGQIITMYHNNTVKTARICECRLVAGDRINADRVFGQQSKCDRVVNRDIQVLSGRIFVLLDGRIVQLPLHVAFNVIFHNKYELHQNNLNVQLLFDYMGIQNDQTIPKIIPSSVEPNQVGSLYTESIRSFQDFMNEDNTAQPAAESQDNAVRKREGQQQYDGLGIDDLVVQDSEVFRQVAQQQLRKGANSAGTSLITFENQASMTIIQYGVASSQQSDGAMNSTTGILRWLFRRKWRDLLQNDHAAFRRAKKLIHSTQSLLSDKNPSVTAPQEQIQPLPWPTQLTYGNYEPLHVLQSRSRMVRDNNRQRVARLMLGIYAQRVYHDGHVSLQVSGQTVTNPNIEKHGKTLEQELEERMRQDLLMKRLPEIPQNTSEVLATRQPPPQDPDNGGDGYLQTVDVGELAASIIDAQRDADGVEPQKGVWRPAAPFSPSRVKKAPSSSQHEVPRTLMSGAREKQRIGFEKQVERPYSGKYRPGRVLRQTAKNQDSKKHNATQYSVSYIQTRKEPDEAYRPGPVSPQREEKPSNSNLEKDTDQSVVPSTNLCDYSTADKDIKQQEANGPIMNTSEADCEDSESIHAGRPPRRKTGRKKGTQQFKELPHYSIGNIQQVVERYKAAPAPENDLAGQALCLSQCMRKAKKDPTAALIVPFQCTKGRQLKISAYQMSMAFILYCLITQEQVPLADVLVLLLRIQFTKQEVFEVNRRIREIQRNYSSGVQEELRQTYPTPRRDDNVSCSRENVDSPAIGSPRLSESPTSASRASNLTRQSQWKQSQANSQFADLLKQKETAERRRRAESEAAAMRQEALQREQERRLLAELEEEERRRLAQEQQRMEELAAEELLRQQLEEEEELRRLEEQAKAIKITLTDLDIMDIRLAQYFNPMHLEFEKSKEVRRLQPRLVKKQLRSCSLPQRISTGWDHVYLHVFRYKMPAHYKISRNNLRRYLALCSSPKRSQNRTLTKVTKANKLLDALTDDACIPQAHWRSYFNSTKLKHFYWEKEKHVSEMESLKLHNFCIYEERPSRSVSAPRLRYLWMSTCQRNESATHYTQSLLLKNEYPASQGKSRARQLAEQKLRCQEFCKLQRINIFDDVVPYAATSSAKDDLALRSSRGHTSKFKLKQHNPYRRITDVYQYQKASEIVRLTSEIAQHQRRSQSAGMSLHNSRPSTKNRSQALAYELHLDYNGVRHKQGLGICHLERLVAQANHMDQPSDTKGTITNIYNQKQYMVISGLSGSQKVGRDDNFQAACLTPMQARLVTGDIFSVANCFGVQEDIYQGETLQTVVESLTANDLQSFETISQPITRPQPKYDEESIYLDLVCSSSYDILKRKRMQDKRIQRYVARQEREVLRSGGVSRVQESQILQEKRKIAEDLLRKQKEMQKEYVELPQELLQCIILSKGTKWILTEHEDLFKESSHPKGPYGAILPAQSVIPINVMVSTATVEQYMKQVIESVKQYGRLHAQAVFGEKIDRLREMTRLYDMDMVMVYTLLEKALLFFAQQPFMEKLLQISEDEENWEAIFTSRRLAQLQAQQDAERQKQLQLNEERRLRAIEQQRQRDQQISNMISAYFAGEDAYTVPQIMLLGKNINGISSNDILDKIGQGAVELKKRLNDFLFSIRILQWQLITHIGLEKYVVEPAREFLEKYDVGCIPQRVERLYMIAANHSLACFSNCGIAQFCKGFTDSREFHRRNALAGILVNITACSMCIPSDTQPTEHGIMLSPVRQTTVPEKQRPLQKHTQNDKPSVEAVVRPSQRLLAGVESGDGRSLIDIVTQRLECVYNGDLDDLLSADDTDGSERTMTMFSMSVPHSQSSQDAPAAPPCYENGGAKRKPAMSPMMHQKILQTGQSAGVRGELRRIRERAQRAQAARPTAHRAISVMEANRDGRSYALRQFEKARDASDAPIRVAGVGYQ